MSAIILVLTNYNNFCVALQLSPGKNLSPKLDCCFSESEVSLYVLCMYPTVPREVLGLGNNINNY